MAQQLLSPVGILIQQLTNAGQPLSGGQIFIYVAGTTTPMTTYTDSTGATPNANPIVLNSAGRLPNVSVWVPSNSPHKMILEDANGVTLATIDQLYGINDPFLINQVSSVLPTSSGTANAQTIANPIPITAQGLGTEQWFIPGNANTGATTAAVDGLTAENIYYLSKALVGGELQPNVPALLKNDGTRWNLAWSAKGPAQDYYIDSGSTNALVATVNQVAVAFAGTKIKLKVANTNTSSATLKVNGAGAVTIYTDGTFSTICPAGSLIANGIYEFISYGGSGWVCTNPSRINDSFTLSLTGF